MISVIIPLYNKQNHILKTLESVLKQTFQDFEIIVVDDGSTDTSLIKVKSIPDPRIRIFPQQNSGVSAARNKGILEARGEFVAFLDADDLWYPEYLETQMQMVNNFPDCDIFATNYVFKDERGRESSTIINNLPFKEASGLLSNYFEVAASSHPPLWTSATMVKRKNIMIIGGFPVGINSGEDLLTWARLAARFKIAYCRIPLVIFNHQSDGNEETVALRLGGEKTVALGLINIYNETSGGAIKKDIKAYIARWFKIWCTLLIEAGKSHKIFPIAIQGIRWGGKLKHFVPLIILSCFPPGFAKKFFYACR